MKLTAAYKRVADWWAAWVEEIPGVNTQGETLEEARENLRDALRMVLEAKQGTNIPFHALFTKVVQ